MNLIFFRLLQQCGQHGKDDYPNWTRNTMGINKQGYESKMNEHNQMQKGEFSILLFNIRRQIETCISS